MFLIKREFDRWLYASIVFEKFSFFFPALRNLRNACNERVYICVHTHTHTHTSKIKKRRGRDGINDDTTYISL